MTLPEQKRFSLPVIREELNSERLRTEICGIKLDNPLILASGILDENGYTMARILREGAAAVVTKSIGSDERTGYMPPVVSPGDGYLLNAIGLTNPGIDNYAEEIAIAREVGKPVIGSIFGKDAEEFSTLAKKMESFGVSALELNLSCPHVKGFGSEIGSDPDAVEEIVNEVKRAVSIPVFAKLSPNVTDIVQIAKAAEAADALVLINTIRGMAIDVFAGKPLLTNVYGGLSGRAIKPVGVRLVYEVKKETGKTIIGVGGISCARDVLEYVMAGSSCVELGTILMEEGKGIFSRVSTELSRLLEQLGFENISDAVGVAISK